MALGKVDWFGLYGCELHHTSLWQPRAANMFRGFLLAAAVSLSSHMIQPGVQAGMLL